MNNNFSEWNELKEQIHIKNKNVWAKERDIWWCHLGKNIGYEENGKNDKFTRPVLVLKCFGLNTVLALPLTTSQKENIFHFCIGEIEGKKSFVIYSQIKLIDTKRFYKKISKLNKDIFQELKIKITSFW
jgi:mRNA-degrading endonuclease toxin of MazEF toxin-antitoxin module